MDIELERQELLKMDSFGRIEYLLNKVGQLTSKIETVTSKLYEMEGILRRDKADVWAHISCLPHHGQPESFKAGDKARPVYGKGKTKVVRYVNPDGRIWFEGENTGTTGNMPGSFMKVDA